MQEYVLFTDSSADLPRSILAELDIRVLQLKVTLDGEATRANDQIEVKDFYDTLRSKKGATTSTATLADFLDAFEPVLAEGKDVLYLGFSSGLSGTYNAGVMAAKELSERYPDRKIVTVDTLCASLGQGLLVYTAACMKRDGADLESVRVFVEDRKLHLCHWFTVDDLFFLKRGGRVSAATAVLGSLLSIKPVMHVDNNGKLVNVIKARGRKDAIGRLFDKMRDTAIDPSSQTIFISHGDCAEDAQLLADRVQKELGVKSVMIDYVGPVIGAHSGPGTLALFFFGTER